MTRAYSIAPIPTEYNGLLYKSRLEAYWQVFFNGCDVIATYEAVTYPVNLAGRPIYTPDFFLALSPVKLIEIKPTEPTGYEIELMKIATRLSGNQGAIISGHPTRLFQIYLVKNGQLVDIDFGFKFHLTMVLRGIPHEYARNIQRLRAIIGNVNIWKGFKKVREVSF